MTAAAVGEIGLTASICFHIAHRRFAKADVLRTGVLLIGLCGILTGIAGFVLMPIALDHHPGSIPGLRLAFAAEPIIFLTGAWTSALQAANLRAWNLARLSQPIFYAVFLMPLIASRRVDVTTVTVVFIASVTMQCIIAHHFCRQAVGRKRGRARRILVGPMMRYGLANLTSRTPQTFNSRLDQLILAFLVPSEELGVYAVAVSLSLIAFPIITSFGSVALPKIAYSLGREKIPGKGVIAEALVGSFAVGMITCIALCAAAPFVVPTLLGPSFKSAVPMLWVLAPGAVVFSCNKVLADILRGFDRSIVVAFSEGAALLVTVLGLTVLVPSMGILGAAAVSTAAYLVAFVMLVRSLLRQVRTSATRVRVMDSAMYAAKNISDAFLRRAAAGSGTSKEMP